jgi:hypothetical protein
MIEGAGTWFPFKAVIILGLQKGHFATHRKGFVLVE